MVCFNKTMSDEMLSRVLELMPELAGTAAQSQVSTIHAACFRILREELNGNAREVAKDWQVKKLVDEVAEELWPDPDNRPGWHEIMAWINASKMTGLVPQESGTFLVENLGAYHGDKVYKVNVRLAAYLKGAKLITFPDMLLMVDVMLRQDSAFRAKWQGRFSHILVDEGQDVSGQAMRILTTLAAPQDNFFIVGDSDQLLYRFTGATPEANLMDGFEQRFPVNLTIKLETNYRSTGMVIGNGQQLIAHNYSNLEGPYAQEYMKDTRPRDNADKGIEFTFTAYPDPESEADAVAESIALYLEGHEEDGITYGGNPGSIFVGARTRAQLAYLEGPLVRRKVPFINIAGGSFWESKHVADVVAYLRLAHNNGNQDAFARVFNIASKSMTMPWKKAANYGEYVNHRFLGKEFLAAAGGDYRNAARAGNQLYKWQPGVRDLTEFVDELELRLHEGPANVLRFILDNCYIRWLKTDEGLTAHDEAENGKLEDLETVINLATEYPTVRDFLSYVDECVKVAQDAKDRNWAEYVIISTVHRLKGLEREIVYGIGWGEGTKTLKSGEEVPAGLLPHTFSLAEPPQFGVLPTGGKGRIEDERCIAFVLVTRAKSEVHLSYPREYRDAKFGPSRFAYEMGLVKQEEPAPEDGDGTESGEWGPGVTVVDEETLAAEAGFAALCDAMATVGDDGDLLDLPKPAGVLHLFPSTGRLEGNIVRFSAADFVQAMGEGWEQSIDRGQLVLTKIIAGDVAVSVFTSVMTGEIAGGVGDDSIRVVLREGEHYRKEGNWITRACRKGQGVNEATIHVAGKVLDKVTELTKGVRVCACGGAQVIKVSKTAKNPGRKFWSCRQCEKFEWAD